MESANSMGNQWVLEGMPRAEQETWKTYNRL